MPASPTSTKSGASPSGLAESNFRHTQGEAAALESALRGLLDQAFRLPEKIHCPSMQAAPVKHLDRIARLLRREPKHLSGSAVALAAVLLEQLRGLPYILQCVDDPQERGH